MSMLLDALREWNCDVEGALERFVWDEELYTECLNTVLEDETFKELGTALEQNRIDDAFDFAHTLKGVLANMGLTPLYDITVRIVEPLRAGRSSGAGGEAPGMGPEIAEAYGELLRARDRLGELLGRG